MPRDRPRKNSRYTAPERVLFFSAENEETYYVESEVGAK